jgi:hypothetical protein
VPVVSNAFSSSFDMSPAYSETGPLPPPTNFGHDFVEFIIPFQNQGFTVKTDPQPPLAFWHPRAIMKS